MLKDRRKDSDAPYFWAQVPLMVLNFRLLGIQAP